MIEARNFEQLVRGLPLEAIIFFSVLARFEFALKQAGYLKNIEDGAKAEADVDKYAQDLGDGFIQAMNNIQQKNLLLKKPPLQQFVRAEQIHWGISPQTQENVSETIKLFRSIRQTRNNLFHGGKYSSVPDYERDTDLLKACLSVIEQALLFSERKEGKLKQVFDCFWRVGG
jgi:hypothetical protein